MPHPVSATAFNPNYLDELVVTRALANGEHAAVLQAYFGETLHAQLVPMAQRALSAKADQHSVVYLLPGLLGSRLGVHTQRSDELLWLDPAVIVGGKLTQLAIGRRRGVKPMGMMLPGYLLLKLTLQAAGFQVRSHAYDWRRSVVELGGQLAKEWLHDPARDIMVVGHSMGGLVLRAALKHAISAKVSRVVQIGSPNQGSWALMQVLRAAYPTVRKLGAVDQQHSAEELVRQLFRGFYSFYEMLPQPAGMSGQWLDARRWPQDFMAPLKDRFRYARRLPRHLATADQRCHAIVGVGQMTACGAQHEQDEIVFEYCRDGDGTVSVPMAQWHGAQHWYVPERHGLLPLHPGVGQAVVDLLRGATTSTLNAQYAPQNDIVMRRRESELRAQLQGKVRWDQLPMNERRELLEPVISQVFSSACRS